MAPQAEIEAPLVSIITVNYNNAAVTIDLLKSIARNSYRNVEVIIVDNASREDASADFKAVYPEVKIIRSATNLGFSGE